MMSDERDHEDARGKSKAVMLRLPPDMLADLRMVARRHATPTATMARLLLKDCLERAKHERPA